MFTARALFTVSVIDRVSRSKETGTHVQTRDCEIALVWSSIHLWLPGEPTGSSQQSGTRVRHLRRSKRGDARYPVVGVLRGGIHDPGTGRKRPGRSPID